MQTKLPDINARIKQLIDAYTDGNVAEFVRKTGISSHQVLNRIFNIDTRSGKYPKPSNEIISKIQLTFPEVSAQWLLSGDGEMPNCGAASSDDVPTVPLLPITAQGGKLNDFVVSVKANECEMVVSPIRDVDFAMTVSGDSMSPEYPNGSQILIKKIDSDRFIEWGRVYVLDTCNGSVIKKVLPTNGDAEKIKCVSINPEYPPFDVALSDVYGMYRVLMNMSLK